MRTYGCDWLRLLCSLGEKVVSRIHIAPTPARVHSVKHHTGVPTKTQNVYCESGRWRDSTQIHDTALGLKIETSRDTYYVIFTTNTENELRPRTT